MKKNTTIIICIAPLLLVSSISFGQPDSLVKKSGFYRWGNFGLQVGFSDNFQSLIGAQTGANFSLNNRHFLKLKGYLCFSTRLFEGTLFSDHGSNFLANEKNISLVYGIGNYFTRAFAIIVSAGISYGEGFYRGKYLYTAGKNSFAGEYPVYEDDKYNYIGLPVELSFMISGPDSGISFDVYGNIHKHPDYGLAVNVIVGTIGK